MKNKKDRMKEDIGRQFNQKGGNSHIQLNRHNQNNKM